MHEARIEDTDAGRPLLPEPREHFGKELDVAAVVAGNADGPRVFLDCRANDVAR